MYTETIRKQIWQKIESNRALLLELGKIVDNTLEENEILTGVYGDDIIYNSLFSISQVIADEIENQD